jgi:hypothetical protein
MKNFVRIAMLFIASVLSAQTRAVTVAPCGANIQPDYGFDGIDCVNCEISGRGQPWIVFHTEPSIHAIRHPGPAEGKLQDGDTLVAIDGLAITTRAAAERYASVKPGESVEFRVRRGSGTATASLIAGGKCAPGGPSFGYAWSTRGKASFEMLPTWTWAPTIRRLPNDTMKRFAWAQSPILKLAPGWRTGFARSAPGWIGIGMFRVLRTPDEMRAPIALGAPFSVAPEVAAIAPDSPAALAGIELGDTLIAVDGISLTTQAGANRFLNAPVGVPLELTIRRNGESRRVTVVPKPPPSTPPTARLLR